MPQLDIFSYFSAATTLVVLFLTLIFVLHTYFLPKIASCLKFRNKIQIKQQGSSTTSAKENLEKDDAFLEVANAYISEMEKISKNISK